MNEELAIMWLRDRASELRRGAALVERAYEGDYMLSTCNYVAAAYRKAAVVLDEAADEVTPA